MAADSLYKIISDNFKGGDLEFLCAELGVDPENLRGETRTLKSLSLFKHMSNLSRLHELLAEVHKQRPALDLKPYLHLVIAELYGSEEAMSGLLGDFGYPVRDFGGREKFSWGSQQWREQKAEALQEQMEADGRIEELLAALVARRAEINLDFYIGQDQVQEPPAVAAAGTRQDETRPDAGEPASAPPAREYENFDLRVGWPAPGDSYPVEVLHSPEGETRKPVYQRFPLDDDDFNRELDYLAGESFNPGRSRAFGQKLRDLLFPGDIWNAFYSSWRAMRREGKGLRLRLRIDPPELSRLPWEYCYDEGLDEFFALQPDTPLVRYIAEPFAAEDLTAPHPVRVLLVIANPQGVAGLVELDAAAEEARIREALAPMGDLVDLHVLPQATPTALQNELAKGYHILHFIGHGVRQADGEGALALEDDRRGLHPLPARQARRLLRDRGIKVVILNACQTAAQEEGEPLMGLAPALVRAEIPAVVAMQFNVPDRAGVIFARTLYTFLAAGQPLDEAVTQMRIGANLEIPESSYWGIPVLFMRAEDGVIWRPPAGEPGKPAQRLVQQVINQQFHIGQHEGDIIGEGGTKVVAGDEVHGSKTEITASKGGIAIGGNVTNSNLTVTHTGRDDD